MPSSESDKNVKIRNNIVTAFIEYQGKLLLLRRSQKVKTMKGKWAGVSGYIETPEGPLTQAIKEIQEETGLTSEKIKVLNEGKPMDSPDNMRPDNITWVVHPFYFHASTNIINLDWEHDQYEWINPKEIENYDTVPRLKEALESVYPSNCIANHEESSKRR
jgi:8-oxo-dGTP diphosphatase